MFRRFRFFPSLRDSIAMDKQLLQKYFAGTCNPEEQIRVIDYLSDRQSDMLLLRGLMDDAERDTEAEMMPFAVENELSKQLRRYVFLNGAFVRRLWQTTAAAAVLLPLFFAWQYFARRTEFKNAAVAKAPAVVDSSWKVVFNNGRSTRRAVLPDGTQVWLTAHSRIQYQPLQYGVNNRRLKLEGEAFFDVVEDAQKPFVVYHGTIATEVLGTAFNVEAYTDEAAIRVSLVSGKVRVVPVQNKYGTAALKVLKPGQVLSFHKKDGSFKIKQLVVKDAAIWKKGMLVMNDVSLKDALQRVERKYGLVVKYPEKIDIDKMRVTAVFKAGDASQIIQNLLFVHNLHFTIHNDVVTVY